MVKESREPVRNYNIRDSSAEKEIKNTHSSFHGVRYMALFHFHLAHSYHNVFISVLHYPHLQNLKSHCSVRPGPSIPPCFSLARSFSSDLQRSSCTIVFFPLCIHQWQQKSYTLSLLYRRPAETACMDNKCRSSLAPTATRPNATRRNIQLRHVYAVMKQQWVQE